MNIPTVIAPETDMSHAAAQSVINAPPLFDTEDAAPLYLSLVDILRVLEFGDSMLPVGAFAFSAGLESAVQCGIVRTVDELHAFVRTALTQAATSDAVAVACAVRAARNGDMAELMEMDAAVLARKPGEENRSMSVRMGKKLMEMTTAVTDLPTVRLWLEHIREGKTPGTWPVAQGMLFADMHLAEELAITVHQYGLAMTILNASMRLMRVTHLDTQRILYNLLTEIPGHCRKAAAMHWRHMTAFAPMNDILAAQHVRAHVRLFMN